MRTKPLLKSLTKAEWRVLLALDSDDTEKQIASHLGSTPNTLHSHIKSIYRRLGVQSRLSAIALLRQAERQTLIEELHEATQTSKSPANQDSNPNSGIETPSSSNITLIPPPDILLCPQPHGPLAVGNMRAG